MKVKIDCIFHCYKPDFVVITIDKAAKNIAFICKIYYISKLLAEIDLSNSKSKTYSKATHSIKVIIQPNIRSCKKFDLNIIKLDKSLPIMYWLPNMHKTLVGVRFIIASYYCSTNPLSDKISKMIFNTVEIFHKKFYFIQALRNSGLFKILFQLPLC